MRGDVDIHPNWKSVRPNEYSEWYLNTPRENADILVKKDTAQFELHLRVNDEQYDKIAVGFSHKIRETAKLVADEIAKLLLTDIEYQPSEEKQQIKIQLENPTDTDAIRYELYDIPNEYIDSIMEYINDEYDATKRVSSGLRQRTVHKIREIERKEAAVLRLNLGKLSLRVNDRIVLIYFLLVTLSIIAIAGIDTYVIDISTLAAPWINTATQHTKELTQSIITFVKQSLFTQPPLPE